MKRLDRGFILIVLLTLMGSHILHPYPAFARRAKTNSIIEAFLRRKDETVNEMVEEIMSSERGARLVDELNRALEEHREGNNLKLPLKIEGLMVPAGHIYEYEVDVSISDKNNFICVTIYGDTEPEGDSQDPSCWDRTKVIIRCVISALRKTGLNIREERAVGVEDPYWFNYYYVPLK